MNSDERVDLLLLNASNLPTAPVFPYAFVQVSAVARRCGVKVARFDFVGIPKSRWRLLLVDLLKKHRPRMVGLHLRQADSVVASDYVPPPGGNPADYYLPVEDTRDLLRLVRILTDVPVVIGGFGFTVHPMKTAKALDVDFGVQGEPDGFFERFEDVLARRELGKVPNLVYRQGSEYRANPRVFYPPPPSGEYGDDIIAELIRFYGDRPLLAGTLPHVPVEFARGCPFRCYFCNEPAVKGRTVRYRNWSAIEEDLAALERHGIRRVWLVCSEINIHPSRAMGLATRMAAINKGRRPDRRIRWRAYNIPRMKAADLRFMLSAGFEPGWNDSPSLDDRNLARCRVPFRTSAALSYYRSYLDWADAQPVPPDNRQTFYLFLGNAFVDARTIRTTLQNVDHHGLQARHEQASVGPATRVFEIDGKLNCGDSRTLVSVGRKGKVPFDVVSPTYYYPPWLVEHLGSEQAVREFLDYVASTFLSTAYDRARHWSTFLGESLSQEGLLLLMRDTKKAKSVKAVPIDTGEDTRLGLLIQRTLRQIWAKPDEKVIRRLFFPGEQQDLYDYVVLAVLTQLLLPHARAFKPILRFLQIPHDRNGFHSLSPYGLARILYRRYDSNDELIQHVCQVHGLGPDTIDRLSLRFLLHQCNVRIRPEYRELLFGAAHSPSGHSRGS
jgi:Radical SAM superfamily